MMRTANRENAPRLRAGLIDVIRFLFGATKVFALVGKSGTGKSFRAKLVAEKYDIDYIVDDGLLIHGNSIVAGKTAKRERVYISAVKTALFDDPHHRHEVRGAIKSQRIRKILLLGTSERMVAKMAHQLHLPPPFRVIFIEEISEPEDMERAQRSRNEEGKHVIPVPSIEVERDYPHMLADSIKVLFKYGFGRHKNSKTYEKSVVQPLFHGSSRGRVAITKNAMGQMIAHCVDEFDNELIVRKVKFRILRGAYFIRAEMETPFNHRPSSDLHKLQNYVMNRIEKFTGILIKELNLVISEIGKNNKESTVLSEGYGEPEIESLEEDKE